MENRSPSGVNYDHVKDQILITGMSGSGKSTLWLDMMVKHKARWKMVFDADYEVHRKLGWPLASTPQHMENFMCKFQAFCFDPFPVHGNRRDGFAFFSKWSWKVCKALNGVKLFCVDEVSKVQRVGLFGVPPDFLEMADAGRKEEIDMLLSSFSPSQVNRDIRMHMSEIICLRHNEPDELAALKENGFNPDEVKALPYPGGYIRRNLLNGKVQTYAPNATRKRNSKKAGKG